MRTERRIKGLKTSAAATWIRDTTVERDPLRRPRTLVDLAGVSQKRARKGLHQAQIRYDDAGASRSIPALSMRRSTQAAEGAPRDTRLTLRRWRAVPELLTEHNLPLQSPTRRRALFVDCRWRVKLTSSSQLRIHNCHTWKQATARA